MRCASTVRVRTSAKEATQRESGGAIRAEPADFKLHVPDGEGVLFLKGLLELVDVRAAKLNYFFACYADEVVMLSITGGFEVAMVLLQVRCLDEPLLAQEIERAVHGRETDAMTALPRDLKDLIRSQMPGLLANDLQNGFTLSREAAA